MISKKCKICGKEIRGWNEKMLDWNFNVHLEKHRREERDLEKKMKKKNNRNEK